MLYAIFDAYLFMARTKSLPIAQGIAARPDLKGADKLLLTEVCNLYHNGGRGVCDATNKHLAERTGEAKETVSRRLAKLEAAGWLSMDTGKAAGFLRTMQPTRKTLACYLPIDQMPPIDQKSIAIDNSSIGGLLTKSIAPIDHLTDTLLTIYGGAIDQMEKSLLIVVEEQKKNSKEEQEKNTQLQHRLDAANAALIDAQKKITELEGQLSNLSAPDAQASRTGGTANLQFPAWATVAFRADWQEWVDYRQSKRDKLKPASLQKRLAQLAAFDEEFCKVLFDTAIASGYTGLVFADTPEKFARYLANKPENAHVNGSRTSHYNGGSSRTSQPSSRFDVEEAVGLARNIAVGLDNARSPEAATGCDDGGTTSYRHSRPSAISYQIG